MRGTGGNSVGCARRQFARRVFACVTPASFLVRAFPVSSPAPVLIGIAFPYLA